MSDNEDWRRERAEQLHGNTDWIIRPTPRSQPVAAAAQPRDVLPMRLPDGARNTVAASVRDPVAAARRDPGQEFAVSGSGARRRVWPYAATAVALSLAAAGWLMIEQPEPAGRPTAAAVSAATVSIPVVAEEANRPALAASGSGCADALAAPALSALIRQGTIFAGDTARVAASATLGAVRQLRTDGATATCHGVLQLQLIDQRPGAPTTMQVVSGPVDYLAGPGPDSGAPVYRVVAARAIVNRLAAMPAVVTPAPVAAVEPPSPVTASVRVDRTPPVAVPTPPAPRSVVAPPGAIVVPRADPPVAAAPPPEIVDPEERTADSDAARKIYNAIARSGDREAIDDADAGRDDYLARSSRCTTPRCTALAYKTWVDRLRRIDEDRSAANAY